MSSISSFPAESVPQAPEDALFGLARAYKADTSPLKVDLVSTSTTACDVWLPIAPPVCMISTNTTSHRELVPTVTTTQSPGSSPS